MEKMNKETKKKNEGNSGCCDRQKPKRFRVLNLLETNTTTGVKHLFCHIFHRDKHIHSDVPLVAAEHVWMQERR